MVPFYNGHQYLQKLLDSIPANIPVLIVVDDGSELDVSRWDNVSYFVLPERGYFAGAVNYALSYLDTDVLVVNQDVHFTGEKWLKTVTYYAQRCGFFGERVQGMNGTFPFGYIHGTFMYITRETIDTVGLLNQGEYPLWGCTAEYQLRAARAGFLVYPVEVIPDMVHERGDHPYGSAILRELEQGTDEHRRKMVRIPPEFSVIIPCHNYGRFLPDAINSLIGGPTTLGDMQGQTLQSFEVIIVDYGSTDDSLEIARSLRSGWKAIRVIEVKHNVGTAEAINIGVRNATGRYVTFLDADDMREPFALRALYTALQRNPGAFVYDTPVEFNKQEGRTKVWNLPEYDLCKVRYKNTVPACIAVARSDFERIGGIPGIFRDGRQDWAFAVQAGSQGVCGVKLDSPGYLYRRENHNRTRTNSDPDSMAKFQARMRAVFPKVYTQEIQNMGCCGSRRQPPVAQQAQMMSIPASADGMVLIEYIGGSVGSSRWGGNVVPSGSVYIFGNNANDKIKLVAQEDAPWFLNKPAEFRLYQEQPAQQADEDHPNYVDTDEGAYEETATPQEEKDQVSIQPILDAERVLDFDPAYYTAKQIKAMVLTSEEWAAVYEVESAGKARIGVLKFVKEMMPHENG